MASACDDIEDSLDDEARAALELPFSLQLASACDDIEDSLDDKARAALDELTELGLDEARADLLVDVREKLDSGEVRNLSAYVTKAARAKKWSGTGAQSGQTQLALQGRAVGGSKRKEESIWDQSRQDPYRQHSQPLQQQRPRQEMTNSLRPGGRSQVVALQVEEAIYRLKLDEKASGLLRSLDPNEAITILESIGDGVRNLSAFITKAANDRLMHQSSWSQTLPQPQQRPLPRAQTAERTAAAKVNEAISQLALDEKASGLLRSLDPNEAVNILESIGDGVRNLSAFITKAANDRLMHQDSRSQTMPPPQQRQLPRAQSAVRAAAAQVNEAIDRLELDEKASGLLWSLDPNEAVNILESIGDGVRNLSAFVTKAVNDRLMHPDSGPRAMPPQQRQFPPAQTAVRAVAAQVEEAISQLALDEKASGLLRSLDPNEAVNILESIGDGVRNLSAFITKAANDRLMHQDSRSKTMLPPQQRQLPQVYPAVQSWQQWPQLGKGKAQGTAYDARGSAPHRPRKVEGRPTAEVEEAIERLQLDGKASDLLRSLEAVDAFALLQSIEDGDIRNPSAFITKAANDRLHGKGTVDGHRWKHVSAMIQELGIDERAHKVLEELPAEEAFGVLERLKQKDPPVNNPSAWVLKAVVGMQKDAGQAWKRPRVPH